jgi:tight adherence protein B
MTNIEPFLYLLIFVAVLAFSESVRLFLTDTDKSRQRRIAQERLKRHAGRLQSITDEEVRSILRESGERGPILKALTRMVPNRRPLDLILYRAGVRMPLETFVGLSVLLGLVGFFIGIILFRRPEIGVSLIWLGIIPFLRVLYLRKVRMGRFVAQLPEAVDLLSRSLRAGHPFNTGLSLVVKELDDPASAEFEQVVEEIAMGMDPRVALTNLSMRMSTPDMPFFVTAVLIQRDTGGDLARVLSGLAHTMRERVQFQIRLDAIVAQTKLSANVLALFPVLFMTLISWLNPVYMAPLFMPGVGRVLLYSAVILTGVGWLVCRRLAVVRV